MPVLVHVHPGVEIDVNICILWGRRKILYSERGNVKKNLNLIWHDVSSHLKLSVSISPHSGQTEGSLQASGAVFHLQRLPSADKSSSCKRFQAPSHLYLTWLLLDKCAHTRAAVLQRQRAALSVQLCTLHSLLSCFCCTYCVGLPFVEHPRDTFSACGCWSKSSSHPASWAFSNSTRSMMVSMVSPFSSILFITQSTALSYPVPCSVYIALPLVVTHKL